jgi:hypothetical protein
MKNLFPVIIEIKSIDHLVSLLYESEEFCQEELELFPDKLDFMTSLVDENKTFDPKSLFVVTIDETEYFYVSKGKGKEFDFPLLVPYVVHPFCLNEDELKLYAKNDWPVTHPYIQKAIEEEELMIYTECDEDWVKGLIKEGKTIEDIVSLFEDGYSDAVFSAQYDIRLNAIYNYLECSKEEFRDAVYEHDNRLSLGEYELSDEYSDIYPEVSVDTKPILNIEIPFRLSLDSSLDFLDYTELEDIQDEDSYLYDVCVALGINAEEFFAKSEYQKEDKVWDIEEKGIVDHKELLSEILNMGSGGKLTVIANVSLDQLYGRIPGGLSGLKSFIVPSGCPIGFFNHWDGGGSMFSATTKKDMTVTIGGNYPSWSIYGVGYSIAEVHGEDIQGELISFPVMDDEKKAIIGEFYSKVSSVTDLKEYSYLGHYRGIKFYWDNERIINMSKEELQTIVKRLG